MRALDLGTLSAVAAGASTPTQGNGFLPGESAKLEIFSPDAAFAGSAQVQTSVDGTTWTNVGVAHTSAGYNSYMITLTNYIRLNATARTAGSVKAVVFDDIG
jgi:hypothetical protein